MGPIDGHLIPFSGGRHGRPPSPPPTCPKKNDVQGWDQSEDEATADKSQGNDVYCRFHDTHMIACHKAWPSTNFRAHDFYLTTQLNTVLQELRVSSIYVFRCRRLMPTRLRRSHPAAKIERRTLS